MSFPDPVCDAIVLGGNPLIQVPLASTPTYVHGEVYVVADSENVSGVYPNQDPKAIWLNVVGGPAGDGIRLWPGDAHPLPQHVDGTRVDKWAITGEVAAHKAWVVHAGAGKAGKR